MEDSQHGPGSWHPDSHAADPSRPADAPPDLVVYTQYYRCSSADRQREIDECLRRNLNHPGISRLVLFKEADAPPLPQASVPLEVVESEERMSYAEWFRWVKRQGSGIGLLLNSDIYLDEGLAHLQATFDAPEAFLALTRYNPGPAGFLLNDFPHWTQDVWGVRADAELPESLLYASSFPLGFPGCDNRIAYVMWSHGFRVRNPCYHVRSVHLQASTARAYDKTSDRLYGGVSYVHPSLAPDEDAELEFTLWTRSQQRPAGVLVNQQAIDRGVHQFCHGDADVAQRFLDLQQFTGMSWVHQAVGSAHLEGAPHPYASEDTVFLPMQALQAEGVTLALRQPTRLEGLSLRLPKRAPKGYRLEVQASGGAEAQLGLAGASAVVLKDGGERLFLESREITEHPWRSLRLKLLGPAVLPPWRQEEGAELILFGAQGALSQAKSLNVIAEPPTPSLESQASAEGEQECPPEPHPGQAAFSWRRRSACSRELEQGEELQCYGSRFRVVRCGEELLFDDRFWPSLGVTPVAALPCDPADRRGLFLWGFGQPTLELRPGFIADVKRFSEDVNFWQYPCRTEADAFAVHRSLVGPQVFDGVLQVYLGLPWATWIDRQAWPTSTLQATAERLNRLRQVLQEFGLGLKVHSVCQHILWRENLHLLKAAGVDCLWLSHKPQAEDALEGVELRPWHLYAVNAREADRREALCIRPTALRPWLATFVGAHMDHYITEVRPQLLQFRDLHRFHIALKDEWHFNPIVYGEQVEDALYSQMDPASWQEDCRRYNLILSDSLFTLCPAGAGPNSLRLWEALSVGSIPVILSDQLVLPDLAQISAGRWANWDQIVIRHPESELDSLPERLEAISTEEIERRSTAAIALMEQVNRFTCLGVRSERSLTPLQQDLDPDEGRPLIVIPVYGPTDRYYWRQKKHGFYDVVLEWYLRGKVRIRFGDKGYFWWGGEGEILLMERDLVIDMLDKKVDPPRWEGEVPYQHAFFFNQYHLANSRNHKATYFTYAPAHLEELRNAKGRVPWSDRSHSSIYCGSIENETQEFFRHRLKGWEEAIEIYALADRLHLKESYRYSMDEYLDLVAHSRFGVCFRGNGPKCFREMEYLAMGTPLILTPGVEVDYPKPLQEGLHFFTAASKEDLYRIVNETTEDQWTAMSKACWQWFDQYGTLDQMFVHLHGQIQDLPRLNPGHPTVRVRASRDVASHSLAVRSLQIMDPQAQWLAEEEPGICTLEVNPQDLIINQLPQAGEENPHQWKVTPEQQRDYCEEILASDLPAHKKLLELMRLRLRNFRIKLSGPHGDIPLWDRLTDDGIDLKSHDEIAFLNPDFDWQRHCEGPYLNLQRTVNGPGPVTYPLIEAVLVYRSENQEMTTSLTDHFNDYYAMYEKLIPEDRLVRTCKLWRFPNCEFLKVVIKVTDPKDASIREHTYHNPAW